MLELAWHLFTWGDRIEIVGPERLKRTMAEALRTATRQHVSDDTTVSVVAAV
jgi:predicted DNA-binding transcriptional regulator YafY